MGSVTFDQQCVLGCNNLLCVLSKSLSWYQKKYSFSMLLYRSIKFCYCGNLKVELTNNLIQGHWAEEQQTQHELHHLDPAGFPQDQKQMGRRVSGPVLEKEEQITHMNYVTLSICNVITLPKNILSAWYIDRHWLYWCLSSHSCSTLVILVRQP